MAVQSIQVSSTGFVPNTSGLGLGQAQQSPTFIFINTNDTLATVLTSGYLNNAVSYFQIPLNNHQIALVYTTDAYSVWLSVSVTGTPPNYTYSLVGTTNVSTVFEAAVGSAAAPSYTFVGRTDTGLYSAAAHEIDVTCNSSKVAAFTTSGVAVTGLISATTTIGAGTNVTAGSASAAGTVTSFPGTANGSLILKAIDAGSAHTSTISNASSVGQNTTYTIPDPGAATASFVLSTSGAGQTIAGGLTISTGNLAVSAGTITSSGAITSTAGALVSGAVGGGFAGALTLFSNTAANGSLRMLAVGNAGNFATTISDNASQSLAQTITIPDAGVATANFLIDQGAANLLAMQQFVGIEAVLSFGTGTWTTTRAAEGNYYKEHSAAAETSIIGIDITVAIQTAASKGFRLDSFDVIYGIGTAAMIANSATLDKISYTNNAAVTVTSVPLTGSLSTATQANPYVTNLAVTTPAFDNTAASKYVVEVTAQNDTTTVYDFYGLILHFTRTIG